MTVKFRYHWWGKGDVDAAFGLFFDGFSKILTATGVLILVFGMPADVVIGKMVPAIGIANFLGNLWYFYEARELAHKLKRQDITAQPYGIGASQMTGWLYLIMGPVYWQTGDAMLAYRVGLTAAFIGGIVEIIGAFAGPWIVKHTPHSALMGNMASGAIVWLSVIGVVMIFDKPIYALIPLFIIVIDYMGKGHKIFKKIPSGIMAIVVGTILAWATGNMNFSEVTSSFDQLGFYLPGFFVGDILGGMKEIVPYLPVIIPLQINNFLTTLQGVESAKQAGDPYPERKSMLADGLCTLCGSVLGNPFPTTVYFGHPGWKEVGARAGYSVIVAVLYLLIGVTGLTGIVMALIPVEAVMVLLVFVGFSVGSSTIQSTDKKYIGVILLSLLPIVFQYVQTLVSSVAQAAGTTVAEIAAEKWAEFSVPFHGIQILGNGAFLSSLLIAAVLACVIDRNYRSAVIFTLLLAGCSFIGLIHCEGIALFPRDGVIMGVLYLAVGVILAVKWFAYNRTKENLGLSEEETQDLVVN
ncbi:MAG: uracil permease [Massiliimalia sp.]|jgi:AGZA family xanthine/uracil permease-like MFS transporter